MCKAQRSIANVMGLSGTLLLAVLGCVEPPPAIVDTIPDMQEVVPDAGSEDMSRVPDATSAPDLPVAPDLAVPEDLGAADMPDEEFEPALLLSRDKVVSNVLPNDTYDEEDLAGDAIIDEVDGFSIVQGDIIGVEVMVDGQVCQATWPEGVALAVDMEESAYLYPRSSGSYLRVVEPGSIQITALCGELAFTFTLEVLGITSDKANLLHWFTSSPRGDDRLILGVDGKPVNASTEAITGWASRLTPPNTVPEPLLWFEGAANAYSLSTSPTLRPKHEDKGESLQLANARLPFVRGSGVNSVGESIKLKEEMTSRAVTVVIKPADGKHVLFEGVNAWLELDTSQPSISIQAAAMSQPPFMLSGDTSLGDAMVISWACGVNDELFVWHNGTRINELSRNVGCKALGVGELFGNGTRDDLFSGEVYDVIIAETMNPGDWDDAIKAMHTFLTDRYKTSDN